MRLIHDAKLGKARRLGRFAKLPPLICLVGAFVFASCEPVDNSGSEEEGSSKTTDGTQDPEESESPSGSEDNDSSTDSKFAGDVLQKFDTLNRFACVVDHDLCVADWAKAREELVQACFSEELEDEDASSQKAHESCYIESLDDSVKCTDKSEETCEEEDEDACDKAMTSCLDELEETIEGCELESAFKIFEDSLTCVRKALEASDDSGGGGGGGG